MVGDHVQGPIFRFVAYISECVRPSVTFKIKLNKISNKISFINFFVNSLGFQDICSQNLII